MTPTGSISPTRRYVIYAVGIAVSGVGGYREAQKDHDGDGLSTWDEIIGDTEPLDPDTNGDGFSDGDRRYVGADSEIENQAAKYANDRYELHFENLETFINDTQVNQDFIDRQLRLWLDADPDWQEAIITHGKPQPNQNAFYMDDWTKDGREHLKPDGTPGPAHDTPFTPNYGVPDPVMTHWYNHSGTVWDVRTGEYLGFQPERGDKVGKLGDKNGNGSIAHYLEGNPGPEDLTGHMTAYLWYDWMDGNEPTDKVKQVMKDVFKKAPVNNPDGSQDIDLRFIEGVKLETKRRTTYEEGIEYYWENVPRELRTPEGPANIKRDGPVDYIGFVRNAVSGESAVAGIEFVQVGNGSLVSDVSGTNAVHDWETNTARIALHEYAGHGLGGLGHHDKDGVMGTGGTTVGFLDDEWPKIIEGLNILNRHYYKDVRDQIPS